MRRLLKSFAYACSGIRHAIATQVNMRIHITVALLVILLGAIVSLSRLEWCVVIAVICAVITAELFNTAIETVIDRYSIETHPLSKAAKDVAAGAVLVTAIGAFIIGLIIFVPKLIELF